MARLEIFNESVRLGVPEMDDELLAIAVLNLAERFASDGGCWLRLDVQEAEGVRWVPATCVVQAYFDGEIPDEVAGLALVPRP